MNRGVRALLWSVFVASLAIAAWGLVSYPEVFDERWGMQTKVKGFIGYVALFWGLAILGFRYWPLVAQRVLILVGVLVLVLAAGLIAPLMVAYTLLAAWCLGDWILQGCDQSDERDPADHVLASVLGLAILASTVGWLSHLRVHYWYSYLAVLTVPVLGNRRPWRALGGMCQSAVRDARIDGPGPYAALMILWFTVGLHLFSACRPEAGYDSLVYHWPIIHTLASSHCFPYPVEDHVWAVTPMLGDWTHAIPYMFAGELGAHLINFASLLMALILLLAACRRHASKSDARLHVALFASTSLAYFLTGSIYIDNTVMLYCVAAVVSLVRFAGRARHRYLWIAAVFLGAAASAKLTGWLMVAVCAVVVLLVSWRQPRLRVPLSIWAGLGGVVLVVAAFPYVNAWALTGNPVFPMFNQWFGSPLFDTDMNFTNSLFRHPLSYRTLFDMTFESGRFMECTTGTMGFHYLVLWPLGVAWTCVRRAPDLWIVLATSVGFFVAVFVFQSYLRYLYPALALATISMCAGAQGLVGGARFARLEFARLELARLAMPMLLLAVFGLNIYNLPAAGSTCGDFPLHDLIAGRREKLRSMIPEYGIIQYVRARYGHDARVCCASNSFVANLEGRALTWTWHSPKFAREMSAAATAEQLAAVVAAYGIRHFIVSGPPGSELFDAYLRESTALEYREGRASLYQVRSKGR